MFFKSGKVLLVIMLIAAMQNLVFAQTDSLDQLQPKYKHQVGSSTFLLFNLMEDPADYYMLSYGYHLSNKDVIIVEAWTWKYNEPIGTYGDSDELYPGKVRAFGIGAGYQRFLWKNLYTTLEATPLIQQFYDAKDKKIQKGIQLYLQCIVGYRFELFNDRWYIEPAFALKYWPVNTNFPEDFAEIEDGKPKHIFEPALNFGFNF